MAVFHQLYGMEWQFTSPSSFIPRLITFEWKEGLVGMLGKMVLFEEESGKMGRPRRGERGMAILRWIGNRIGDERQMGENTPWLFLPSFPSGSIFVSSVPENSELKEHVNETRLSFGLLYGRNKPPEEMQFFTQTLGSGSLIVRQGEMSVPPSIFTFTPKLWLGRRRKIGSWSHKFPSGQKLFPNKLNFVPF